MQIIKSKIQRQFSRVQWQLVQEIQNPTTNSSRNLVALDCQSWRSENKQNLYFWVWVTYTRRATFIAISSLIVIYCSWRMKEELSQRFRLATKMAVHKLKERKKQSWSSGYAYIFGPESIVREEYEARTWCLGKWMLTGKVDLLFRRDWIHAGSTRDSKQVVETRKRLMIFSRSAWLKIPRYGLHRWYALSPYICLQYHRWRKRSRFVQNSGRKRTWSVPDRPH